MLSQGIGICAPTVIGQLTHEIVFCRDFGFDVACMSVECDLVGPSGRQGSFHFAISAHSNEFRICGLPGDF